MRTSMRRHCLSSRRGGGCCVVCSVCPSRYASIRTLEEPSLWWLGAHDERSVFSSQRRCNLLRASANRLRSAARSSFPAVAGPSFSDESPHDDDHLREGQPEVDDLLPALGTPYQLLVGILPGVGA